MKAYVLRNDGLEFMWSWNAGPASPDGAPTNYPEETPGNATADGDPVTTTETSALKHPENPEATIQDNLNALDTAIRVAQEPSIPDSGRP